MALAVAVQVTTTSCDSAKQQPAAGDPVAKSEARSDQSTNAGPVPDVDAVSLDVVVASSNISIPRARGRTPSIHAINLELDKLRRRVSKEAAYCERDALGRGSHFEFSTWVAYNENGLLSLRFDGESYCGGANGTPLSSAITFDLHTGETVDLLAAFGTRSEALATLGLDYFHGSVACSEELRQRELAPLGDVFLTNEGLALSYDFLTGAAEGCSQVAAVIPPRVVATNLIPHGPAKRAWSARIGPSSRRPPIDDCAADPALNELRQQLSSAVRRKDLEALSPLIDANILIDFGGGSGRGAFAEHWKLGRPLNSPLWSQLEAVLKLGCRMVNKDVAVSPSFSTQLPEGVDLMNVLIGLAGRPVRARPDQRSDVRRYLDWDLISLRDADLRGEWLPIRRAGKIQGYVSQADVRSPLDYRAVYEMRDRRWLITQFVAGD